MTVNFNKLIYFTLFYLNQLYGPIVSITDFAISLDYT